MKIGAIILCFTQLLQHTAGVENQHISIHTPSPLLKKYWPSLCVYDEGLVITLVLANWQRRRHGGLLGGWVVAEISCLRKTGFCT